MAKRTNPFTSFLGNRTHRLVLAVVATLLLAAFGPTLVELVEKWTVRPEYSHGFLMPLVAGWMVWERRDDYGRLEPSASFLGVVLLLGCLSGLVLAELAVFEVVKPYAFVGSLVAVLWSLYGWTAVRVAGGPIVALLLMCPLPRTFVTMATFPLKRSAAIVATGLLDVTGVQATLDGNVIRLPGIDSLFVADACSGVNSLISLLSLALLACILWRRHWLVRLAVVVSCAPVAILANGLRIWLTGLLSVRAGPEAAEGFFHFFQGLALFAVGILMLWAWAAILGRAFETRTASS